MVLVFQGQVEVSKDMMVKTPSGFKTSRKPIIRLETTDPRPKSNPITESTVFVVEAPAFGIGEFSLVLDNAIRTSHVHSTTPLKYGVLSLDDFTNIVKENPEIGGAVYFEVAKSAVNNFVKLISKDLAQNNILINCIAPGNILFKGSTWEKKLKKNKLKIKRYIDENVPLKKFGNINENFYLCNYLCSEQNFSTGSTFVLDGGQTKKFI